MNRSFLQKLQPAPGEPPSPDVQGAPDSRSESLVLKALNLTKLIVNRRRVGLPESDLPDVTQDTALRLWKWLRKFREKSDGMSSEEWGSFTARSAFNEINRYRTALIRKNEVPLEDLPEVEDLTTSVESELEMTILVREVWQGICSLSLYQRRVLLFHSAELLIYLMQFGIGEQRISKALSFEVEEWRILSAQLPLTDIEIANLIKGKGSFANESAAVRNIKKARYDARKKLEKLKR
ncbi:MAG: hypothetical protein WAU71_09370 [Pyrinomonadaceae bacterium]